MDGGARTPTSSAVRCQGREASAVSGAPAQHGGGRRWLTDNPRVVARDGRLPSQRSWPSCSRSHRVSVRPAWHALPDRLRMGPAPFPTSTSPARTASGRRGTARSKVWFTVANGILSDVYYPTIDNTNVETLQYVVTDGSTFTDLQSRDTTSTVSALDKTGMACRVTSTAKSGKYRLQTDYVTDPSRNTLLMHTLLTPLVGGPFNVYVRFDASVNGNGGGGGGNGGPDSATVDTSTGHPIAVSSDTSTATQAANRDYAQPVYRRPRRAVQRRRERVRRRRERRPRPARRVPRADPDLHDRQPGNVVQTAAVRLSHALEADVHARPRLRDHPEQGRQGRRGLDRQRVRQGAQGLRVRLDEVRRGPQRSVQEAQEPVRIGERSGSSTSTTPPPT